MSLFRPKLWTAAGGALLIAASGLAACSQADDAAKTDTTPAATAGEGEGGEGEGGEAGATSAYDAVPAPSKAALQLAHLKGFFLVAQAVAKPGGEQAEAEAAALAGQGMLEVFDPQKADFASAGVNEQVLRRAAEAGSASALNSAVAELDRAARDAGGDNAAVVRGMLSIANGLYGHVVTADGVDPVEWQHSYGAALAAKSIADRDGKLAAVRNDMNAFVALWPTVTAPEAPADAPAPGAVSAQASRIELALQGL